ncbi:MAG: hypothetical protein WA966_07240 [Ornithinimicrobium sp.]
MNSVLDVLRDVVDPAVRAVLRDNEVTSLELTDAGDDGTYSLRLVAGDDLYTDNVVQALSPETPVDVWCERLRSNLVDFVAESGFGWGQNREDGPPT